MHEIVRLSEGEIIGESSGIHYRQYKGEEELEQIIKMVEVHLSEPYPIYTYRYFVNKWPELTWLVCLLLFTHTYIYIYI